MTVTLGILALLEAKPGKGDQPAEFLKAGRELAVAEQGTVTALVTLRDHKERQSRPVVTRLGSRSWTLDRLNTRPGGRDGSPGPSAES